MVKEQIVEELVERGRYSGVIKALVGYMETDPNGRFCLDYNFGHRENNIVLGSSILKGTRSLLTFLISEDHMSTTDLPIKELSDLYSYVKHKNDMELHNYAIYKSHKKKPLTHIDIIRDHLVLESLLEHLCTDFDNMIGSFIIPVGWRKKS